LGVNAGRLGLAGVFSDERAELRDCFADVLRRLEWSNLVLDIERGLEGVGAKEECGFPIPSDSPATNIQRILWASAPSIAGS
jgi:hypothetical protein